jgi:SM-20-related protein
MRGTPSGRDLEVKAAPAPVALGRTHPRLTPNGGTPRVLRSDAQFRKQMSLQSEAATKKPNGTGKRQRQFVVVRDFLRRDELNALLEHTLRHEADFRAAEAETVDDRRGRKRPAFRRGRVLTYLGNFGGLIKRRVRCYVPEILRKLGLAPITLPRIGAQITATNDGEFLKKHIDSSTEFYSRTILSFAYYFYREPRRFTGGELRLYRTIHEDGRHEFSGKFDTVMPRQNQIVFFPSWVVHEIRPVRCPSRRLADSRFTFNGWVGRK